MYLLCRAQSHLERMVKSTNQIEHEEFSSKVDNESKKVEIGKNTIRETKFDSLIRLIKPFFFTMTQQNRSNSALQSFQGFLKW